MTWNTPAAPIAATVITVAWAQSQIVDLFNHLRALTGGADAPAANRVAVSTGTTTSTWQQVPTDAILDQAVTNAKISNGTISGDAKHIPSTITGNSGASAIGTGVIHANRIVGSSFDATQVNAAFIAGAIHANRITADTFDATQVAAAFNTDSISVANAADIISDAAIVEAHLATNAVATAKIQDGAVTHAKITPVAALSNTQVGSLAFTTSNQTLATITAATAGTYIVHAHVKLFTTTTAGDTGQSLTAELNGPAGVFGTEFKHFTGATAVDQHIVQAQTQLIALTAGQTVTLRGKKSGGTGTSGAISGTLVAERIAA